MLCPRLRPHLCARTLLAQRSLLSTQCHKSLPESPAAPKSLQEHITQAIRTTGPITVARYMELCLTNPTWGYYSQGDVFGASGDFVTSPEISQVFGELVAVWMLTRWEAAGRPSNCRILELGPGRGTLMKDILRTLHALGMTSLSSIHLVEKSERLRELQADTLAVNIAQMKATVDWTDDISDVPESSAFTMAIAHEFFDALPIHILQHQSDGFREVRVDQNPSYLPGARNAPFAFAVDPQPSFLSALLPASSSRFKALPIGSRLEVSPDSSRIVRRLGEMISPGGAGLIVDYGGDKAFGDSFRAFRKHKVVDVFDEPGSSDLTANVDFAYLRESLEGTAAACGPITQAKFLLALGLQPRLAKLMAAASSTEQKERLREGARRLIAPVGMGTQYQVMGLIGGQRDAEVYPF